MAGANKLTVASVRAAAKPGRLSDGNRLYLNVSKAGTKSWVVLYVLNGRQREMGLGSADVVSLAAAREQARAAADLIGKGRDPLAERDRPAAVETKRRTFGEMVEEHLTAMGPSWRNAKHRDQWAMTLRVYGGPLKGMPVADVMTADVLAVLRPIWSTKPETASRLRGRIEAVLDRAKALGWRTGENAAAWKGNLALVLPSRAAGTRGHHTALPYAEVPAFMKRLATVEGTSARALAFTILTAARSGESLNASWPEFDADLTVWTVPAARMKGGREHRVPLNDAARAILRQQQASRLQVHGEWVFPGAKPYRPLSNMAMELVLRRLGVAVTPHGFRSSFRDWCAEKTTFPSEVAELALAHQVGSKVERAYRRSDLFDRRADLMREWGAFLDKVPVESATVT